MIEHIIHHIWLGSLLPKKYDYFIQSMKDKNPAWTFMLWDENAILSLPNFSARDAYLKSKNLAVKSDIARYEILRQYGGFYFDTDFECIKPLDNLASLYDFIACKQFSYNDEIGNAMLASKKNHPLLDVICANLKPIRTSEMMDIINGTGPVFLSNMIYGNKDLLSKNGVVLDCEYFFPVPNNSAKDCLDSAKKSTYITDNTHGIHFWDQSWFDNRLSAIIERKIRRALRRLTRLFKKA